MDIIIVLIIIFVFTITALRWGFKGGEGWNSPEWERRRNWRGFH